MTNLDLGAFFAEDAPRLSLVHGQRSDGIVGDLRRVRDTFEEADCVFLRTAAITRFRLDGDYRLKRSPAGGWLLHSRDLSAPSYWLPAPTTQRRTSAQGHILEERAAELDGFDLDSNGVTIDFSAIPEGWTLDAVIWKLIDPALIDELQTLTPIETQGYFLLGSHTRYGQPADLYRHLIHGWVYEDRYAWPHQRRICSENDAHALHLVFNGLQLATGKRIYRLLKAQLLLSVLSRQSEDGGFRHGEWTGNMEAHYRLNASAMHLFLDTLQYESDPTVIGAAKQLAEFLTLNRDDMSAGVWFLHDELEHSPEGMNLAPFKWRPSCVLGKSPSNMLVLNTHLDTSIALDRFGKVCGETRYQPLVDSACKAAQAVLSMNSAERLYQILFYAIGLTLLPTDQARKLPLPLRALKRLAWKYLNPNLYRIKVIFPRLVMPNGYIDRNLALGSFAFHYLTINLMDLTRFRRRFKEVRVDELIAKSAFFIQTSGVRERWKELKYERYALGFWAEALWHICQEFPDHAEYQDWYKEACADLEAMRMGLPPSHLRGNAEAIIAV